MNDRVIVITGASSGIGAALAELVGGRGARPVLVARRADVYTRPAAQQVVVGYYAAEDMAEAERNLAGGQ
jgi:NADP-dependent 3-hydroxy acid dehydrogenase YdfG